MKKLLLGTVALAAVVMGADRDAHAVPAYAYAEMQFTSFALTGIFGNPDVSTLITNVSLQDAATYSAFPPAAFSSTNGNVLTGATMKQATAGPGLFPASNVFTQQMVGQNGTRGDGLIVGPLAGGATSNLVAEGNLASFGKSATSQAGSTTTLSAKFTVASGSDAVTLSFNASDTLIASVGALGDHASDQLSASYNILDLSTGDYVAICGSSAGGPITCTTAGSSVNGATVRPANLNLPGSATIPGLGTNIHNASAPYSYTALLPTGIYELTLADGASDSLSTAPAVPEPASLTVFGVGLLGLAGAVRRRWKTGVGWRRSKT